MLLLAADENFNHDIIRGLRRRDPSIDILRAQDAGLRGADDAMILAWAAAEGRVLLTHDVSTISSPAYDRVVRGLAMPGVFEVNQSLPIGQTIDEIELIAKCSDAGEWEGQVRYLPLR